MISPQNSIALPRKTAYSGSAEVQERNIIQMVVKRINKSTSSQERKG
jgi:hypothetical protein